MKKYLAFDFDKKNFVIIKAEGFIPTQALCAVPDEASKISDLDISTDGKTYSAKMREKKNLWEKVKDAF